MPSKPIRFSAHARFEMRRRLGQPIGGDQGKALVAEADRWMTSQGVRNPARMTAVYAPGFADPSPPISPQRR